MNNTDAFSLFSSKILLNLSADFPVASSIRNQALVEEVLSTDERTIDKLKNDLSANDFLLELNSLSQTPILTVEQASTINQRLKTLNQQIEEKQKRKKQLESILEGTISFLEAEGYIRRNDENLYQLTARGFSQLRKKFDFLDNSSLLSKLPEALQPGKIIESVTSGVVTGYISGMLGS